ncbi:hypothetical protein [Ligilactobacillus salivarius]|uniref:hypothetical protein n=1 Tax=Ligilactobacillus salivarius TaxID=1624 RepID=UPI000BAF528F|nr:hypothetical protein [Ligilactobacillus salivarius]PAY38099.1 hypothetical protein A8C54_10915 [Ligilactobacillus salivarius]
MGKVNTDNIPLTLLTEIDDAIYENSGIGLHYADETVSNEYVDQVVEILEYLGYEVKVFHNTYPRHTKSLSIDFCKPTKSHGDCELDCAIEMLTAGEAWERWCKNLDISDIVSKTYEAHKKGEALKERLNDVSSIMGGTELWWLEAYYDIHVHTIDDGNTVVFEVKEVEI